jgi:hypothetical protein
MARTHAAFCKMPIRSLLIISLCALVVIAGGQSSTKNPGQAQGTQARGIWTDPSTGLIWAGKDNGKDVSWKNAMKYCRDLRLAGYSDWRLANMAELQPIYDPSTTAPGLAGPRVQGNVPGTSHQFHAPDFSTFRNRELDAQLSSLDCSDSGIALYQFWRTCGKTTCWM